MPSDAGQQTQFSRAQSPWALGTVAVGWLALLGIVVRDPGLVIGLWIITTTFMIFLIADRRPSSARPISKGPELMGAATADDVPTVLTSEEAAGLLRIEHETVIKALRAGQLPGNQLAGQWRIRSAALFKWLDGPSRF